MGSHVDSEQLSAAEYAQNQRRLVYEKYKEQQRKDRLIFKTKKEKEKLLARQEKSAALRALVMRASDLS